MSIGKNIYFFLVVVILSFSLSAENNSLKVLDVEVYFLKNSNWSQDLVQEKMNEAALIMEECGIEVNIVNSSAEVDYSQDGSIGLLTSRYVEEFHEEETRLHSLIGAKVEDHILRVFFVGRVNNLVSIFGSSRRAEINGGEIYENATYVTNQIRTEDADLTIAHEMGHVLLNEGHYHLDPTPNIMHYQFPHQIRQFNSSQCRKMRSSSLVK